MDRLMPQMMSGSVHVFGWQAKADRRLAFTGRNSKDLDHPSPVKTWTKTV